MQKSIDKNYAPITKEILIHSFSQLGINQGDTLLVHTSLSSLGYVVGGAEALFWALRDVIGNEGTIVVPSQTVEISDPASWQYPPVPQRSGTMSFVMLCLLIQRIYRIVKRWELLVNLLEFCLILFEVIIQCILLRQ